MQANNLPGYCSQFPPAGTDLCIPQSCNLHTVAGNDTCYGIAQAYNGTFSATQLISWNPNINRQCSNLNQIAGYQICVRYVAVGLFFTNFVYAISIYYLLHVLI